MNYTLALCKVGDTSSWCLRARAARCDVWRKRKKWEKGEKKNQQKPPQLQEPDGKSSSTTGPLLQCCL